MSMTVKREWSSPDGWHMNHRLERKARPAGRIKAIVEAELALVDGDDWVDPFDGGDEPEPEAHCFVCGRHTDHVGEHDDLVDAGDAEYGDDFTVRWTDKAAA